MVSYRVSYTKPHRHFISFVARFTSSGEDTVLQLPSWRPGRYELGNFAKNIRNVHAFDEEGRALKFEKISKDAWRIFHPHSGSFTWFYEYYAAELNAGSSYLDESQLYINPVNCFFYDVSDPDQSYEISFNLPLNYIIACGLKKIDSHTLWSANFDELADSPLMASDTLKHDVYSCHGVDFHLWVQGDIAYDQQVLKASFIQFTEVHFEIFSEIPCEEYHFLFQFPSMAVRHGVEHRNSTVIAMGPASGLVDEKKIMELLGISCHELFHTWNVKSIRPVEMREYNFTKENYSPSGFVCEGVTTYYGDLLLWRSGVYSDEHYLRILSESIERHRDNDGRFNLSVAESSWDTWLDGYVPGIPWRKVSIYNEGCLIAFVCDIWIMRFTSKRKSLDDAMRIMYERYGKTHIGYSAKDFQEVVEEVAGQSFEQLFGDLVFGCSDYLPVVNDCLNDLGLELVPTKHIDPFTSCAGARVQKDGKGKLLVLDVMEDSPADEAGIWRNDLIETINGKSLFDDEAFSADMNGPFELGFVSNGLQKSTTLRPTIARWYDHLTLQKKSIQSREESELLGFWQKRKN